MSTTAETQGNEKAHQGKGLFNALVPVRAWMQDKQLRSWQTVLLVILVVVPAYVMSQTSAAPATWPRGLQIPRCKRTASIAWVTGW